MISVYLLLDFSWISCIFATEIGKVSQIPRRIAVPKGRVWETFFFFSTETLDDE